MLPLIALQINSAIAKYIQLVEAIDNYSLDGKDKKAGEKERSDKKIGINRKAASIEDTKDIQD